MSNLISVKNDSVILNEEASKKIAEFERMAKLIETEEKKLKKAILTEMEEKGIIKVESEEMTITYIAPTDRERFDSKKFRAENAELYDKYISMSSVSASVRIKLKGDKK